MEEIGKIKANKCWKDEVTKQQQEQQIQDPL